MGFSGQLASVNLADIVQTLHMNRQTGTLSVRDSSTEPVHVWFDQGMVAACSADPVDSG